MNQKWKTLIISLLTPSSIISGIALIVLWGYFSRLGRLDIFFDVMNIKSILVLVCCATILSLAMIVFIFFITSFFIPVVIPQDINNLPAYNKIQGNFLSVGFAPIFPDICYHLTHYKPAAADIPVASDNPAHYADAIRYNARTPLQGSLLPLTRLVWA